MHLLVFVVIADPHSQETLRETAAVWEKNNTFCAVHAPLDLKAPTGDQIQCHATARGLYTVLLYLKVKVSTRPPNTWIEHPFDVLEQVQSMEATPGIRLDLTSRGRNKRPLGCPVVSCSDGNSGSL